MALADYLLMVGWSVLLFYGGAPARWHSSRWLAADVAAAISSAVVIGRAFPELISGGIDSVPTDMDAALARWSGIVRCRVSCESTTSSTRSRTAWRAVSPTR